MKKRTEVVRSEVAPPHDTCFPALRPASRLNWVMPASVN